MTAPWIQTASGVAFDLVTPSPLQVRFAADVAPALARTPRFGGHVSLGPYSVAQHCVIGAEALFDETHRADIAAHFLLHDAHEAYIGDITTPVAVALSGEVDIETGASGAFTRVLDRIKATIDVAIFKAAGLSPLEPEDHSRVTAMDLRMLETERRQLLCQCERHWDAGPVKPLRIRGGLKPWPWPEAADRWLRLLRELCPRSTL